MLFVTDLNVNKEDFSEVAIARVKYSNYAETHINFYVKKAIFYKIKTLYICSVVKVFKCH